MRIAVLGAGAMGSWFGGRLALGGSEVQLLTTNRAHREAVRADGLALRGAAGEQVVRLPIDAPEAIAAPVDLVLLFTKAFQSGEAMASVAHGLGDATLVLSLQNGLGNAEAIARHVPPERVLLGVSMMPVDRVAPGVVVSMGEGASWFGGVCGEVPGDAPGGVPGDASDDGPDGARGDASDGAPDGARDDAADDVPDGARDALPPGVRAVLDAFAASGLDLRHDGRIRERIWQKVAFNAGMNAVSALARGTPGTVGRLAEARELVRETAREVAAVAAAEGVALDLDAVFATIDFACTHHGEHKASMRQDLEAGRRTEVDALNGAVVTRADVAGVPVPLNRSLATLVRLAELAARGDG